MEQELHTHASVVPNSPRSENNQTFSATLEKNENENLFASEAKQSFAMKEKLIESQKITIVETDCNNSMNPGPIDE